MKYLALTVERDASRLSRDRAPAARTHGQISLDKLRRPPYSPDHRKPCILMTIFDRFVPLELPRRAGLPQEAFLDQDTG